MKNFRKFVGFYQKRSNGTNSQRSYTTKWQHRHRVSPENTLYTVAAAVVSDAIPAPIKHRVSSFCLYTSGANFFLLPPKTIAEIGTPSGASASEEYEGYFSGNGKP